MDIRNDIKYYMAREAVTFKQLAAMMSEKTGKIYNKYPLGKTYPRKHYT